MIHTPPLPLEALQLAGNGTPRSLRCRVLQSPLAGVSDRIFRGLVRRWAPDALLFTEMVNATSLELGHGLMKVEELSSEAGPIGVQLFDHRPAAMADAARRAEAAGAFLIDINMGCPVDKVAKKNGGSLLLRDCPATALLAERIVKAVERASGGRVPVTAKMRLGWDPEHMVAPDLARRLADAGIAAVTVHGRYTVQFFSGQADWDAIGRVVEAVSSIPVIGNGDVVEPEHAKALIDRSGCAGIMIARAALRTPWMFRRAAEHLATGTVGPDLSFNDKCRAILRHIDLMERFAKPWYGVKRLNQGIAWYGRTMGHIKPLKEAVRTATTFEAMRSVIQDWMTPEREHVPAVLRGRETIDG